MNFKSNSHIEGFIYESTLECRVTGENSKNPGTPYITGNLSVATDDACTNIVTVHYTYVTPNTAKGTPNQNYSTLKQIIDGDVGTIMRDGRNNATMIRIDSNLGLNEFYSDRSGQTELVSVRRNEGGYAHFTQTLNDEATRATFDVDMVITATNHIEADPDKGISEKLIIKGAIFDFRKAILPYEFSVVTPAAISYFERANISAKNPLFTNIRGKQISETIVRRIEEESAFGDASVREVTSSRKDMIVDWARPDPYLWDDESTITVAQFTEALQNREIYLAGIKKRQDDYKASKNASNGISAFTSSNGTFNF